MLGNPYEPTLTRIWDDIQEVEKQEEELRERGRQLALRKTQLIQSFEALLPLVYPDKALEQDIKSLSLADAIRLAVTSRGKPMRPRDIRDRLEELGFSIRRFNNPMASIHTAINRMEEAGELSFITDSDDGTKLVERGPHMKPVPDPGDDPIIEKINAIFNVEEKEKPRGAASQKGKVKTDDAASTKIN